MWAIRWLDRLEKNFSSHINGREKWRRTVKLLCRLAMENINNRSSLRDNYWLFTFQINKTDTDQKKAIEIISVTVTEHLNCASCTIGTIFIFSDNAARFISSFNEHNVIINNRDDCRTQAVISHCVPLAKAVHSVAAWQALALGHLRLICQMKAMRRGVIGQAAVVM